MTAHPAAGCPASPSPVALGHAHGIFCRAPDLGVVLHLVNPHTYLLAVLAFLLPVLNFCHLKAGILVGEG